MRYAWSVSAHPSEIALEEQVQRTGQAARRFEIEAFGQLVAQGDGICRFEHSNTIAQAELVGDIPASDHAGAVAGALGVQLEVLDAELLGDFPGERCATGPGPGSCKK